MEWTVEFSKRAAKQAANLPKPVRDALAALVQDIESDGPVRGDWPNYSKLSESDHHCHIKRGRPCNVAVWRQYRDKLHFVEVIYAGTHEKAPY